MGRTRRDAPSAQSAQWPDRKIEGDAPSETVRLFVCAIRDATTGWTLRQIEEATGIDDAVIARILSGKSWPDARTIARLEHGLDCDLWPRRFGGTHSA